MRGGQEGFIDLLLTPVEGFPSLLGGKGGSCGKLCGLLECSDGV
jgi:hypothetical protein